MEKKWYTLRIYSGQEAKIKAHIEAEIKLKGIEDKVGRIIIPSENVVEMRDGKKRVKNRVFFSGVNASSDSPPRRRSFIMALISKPSFMSDLCGLYGVITVISLGSYL